MTMIKAEGTYMQHLTHHNVDHSPKLGGPDLYDKTFIQQQLRPYGYTVKHFDEVDSTMDEALLVPNEKWVGFADFQRKGRGRRSVERTKSWKAEKFKSILFTINIPRQEGTDSISIDPTLPQMFALALTTGLQKVTGNVDLAVRYPSDLTVKGAKCEKLGGALIEHHSNRTVLGGGINVYPQEFGDTDYGVTTLSQVYDGPLQRQDLLIAMVIEWDQALNDLKRLNEEKTYDKYNARWHKNAALTDHTVQIVQDDVVVYKGTVMKSNLGRPIMLRTKEGEVFVYERYDSGTKIKVIN